MIAFESGFHFTGTRNGIYIEALSRLGYSVKRKKKRSGLKQQPTTETAPQSRSDTVSESGKASVSDVRAQSEQPEQWDVEKLWDRYKTALQAGRLGLTARQQKVWFSQELASVGQQWVITDITALSEQWLERAANQGIVDHNPSYTPTNRKPKYIQPQARMASMHGELAHG